MGAGIEDEEGTTFKQKIIYFPSNFDVFLSYRYLNTNLHNDIIINWNQDDTKSPSTIDSPNQQGTQTTMQKLLNSNLIREKIGNELYERLSLQLL